MTYFRCKCHESLTTSAPPQCYRCPKCTTYCASSPEYNFSRQDTPLNHQFDGPNGACIHCSRTKIQLESHPLLYNGAWLSLN